MTEINFSRDISFSPFNRHWQFCVGSPHATYALRHDYVRQLKLINQELGIERVRFHGIFCDDMHTYHKLTDIFPIPGGGRFYEKSFRWCAAVYDNILSCNMKPFVELSFMPKHLAKSNKKGLFFYKPNISLPKSYEQWSQYIKDFITFLIERYGRQEIESWHFEVWNEPDLRLPFFNGSREDYFRLYQVTALAIKEVDENIKVGGPSTSSGRWIEQFCDFCEKNNVPLDFITTHQYAGDPLGGIEEKKDHPSLSVDILATFRKNIRRDNLLDVYRRLTRTDKIYKSLNKDNLILGSKQVKTSASALPLYYTEWNLCAAFSAPCNDTRMTAAYVLHSIFGTQHTIDGSSLWCFTDLFEELHPFPQEFHGGFGLLTQGGVKKPLFYALKLLSQAGDEIAFPADKSNEVKLALIKKDKLLTLVAALPVTDINRKACREVTVSLNLAEEPKNVFVKKISEKTADPLALWQEMGSPEVLTKSQVDEINRLCEPVSEDMPFSYTQGLFTVNFTLKENDVHFITIES